MFFMSHESFRQESVLPLKNVHQILVLVFHMERFFFKPSPQITLIVILWTVYEILLDAEQKKTMLTIASMHQIGL